MYEGEVFTFRNDRPPRQAARPQRPSAAPDLRNAEALAAAERMARLETTVLRLEESLSHLTGVVQLLADRVEEAETARTKAAAAPEPPPPPAVESVPKVSVQMIQQERPAPPPPPADVKVSLFGGSSTEAILGQVRVTHNG